MNVAGEVRAGEAGHHDVGEQQINPVCAQLLDVQGLLAVAGVEDAVPHDFERLACHRAHGRVVIDEQDRHHVRVPLVTADVAVARPGLDGGQRARLEGLTEGHALASG